MLSGSALAQLPARNEAGVAMGHLHFNVRDPEASRKFWVEGFGAVPGTSANSIHSGALRNDYVVMTSHAPRLVVPGDVDYSAAGHIRTVAMPSWTKTAIDAWTATAG